MKMVNVIPWLAYRTMTRKPKTIVLHATAGGSVDGAIRTLRRFRLSYHYIIDKDGTVYKCVPVSGKSPYSVAFHAGRSLGPRGPMVNFYSIGIAFVNRNDGLDPYTTEQLDSAEALIKELKTVFPWLENITTHYAVSPGRKTDPKNFPLEAFAARVGLPVWLPSSTP